MHKNNLENNNEKFMTKVKDFINKFKGILAEMEVTEVDIPTETTLAEGKIADTEIVLRWGEVGQPVMKVAIAEDGTETTEAMPEGEYVLETGDVLVVDAMGNLTELKPKAEAPLPIPEEELAVETPAPEVPVEEAPVETPMVDVSAKTLGEIVDVTKDGEYEIKVVVAGGAITEATVEAAQDLIKKADFEAVQLEVTTLKAENAELTEKLSKIKVKPLFTEFNTPRVKDEFIPKNNLENTLHKLGLDK
jgi:hypothetical protein